MQFLFDHVGLKLLALALALALFALVRCETETVRTVHLDVVAELPAAGSDRVLVNELPAKVRVDLRGPRTQLGARDLAELKTVRIDLRSDGRATLELAELVRVPDPIEIVRVEPNRLRLEWRQRVQRQVPVRLHLEGSLPAGLAFGHPVRPEPANVAVTGPAEEVAKLQFVDSEELSVGALGVGTYQLPVRLRSPPGRVSLVDDGIVSVRIDLHRSSPFAPAAPAAPRGRVTEQPSDVQRSQPR